MKQLLTTIAILVCLSAKGQTIPAYLDSTAQVWCANIEPLPIATFSDSVNLTQVRIAFVGSVPGWYAWLRFSMHYQQVSTGRYIEFVSWTKQVNMPAGPINPAQAAFTYFRDSLTVDDERIENIVYVAP
jgi:hypothetical protein